MRLALACVAGCALGGCIVDDAPRFDDKGHGVWVEAPAPVHAYRAVWGPHAADVFAVGDGAAHFDGAAWSTYELPAARYRAIWGRSGDQIWIGGDDVLLARTLTGWQAQQLFDHDRPITEFSVLAITGDAAREYAVIRTGARLLLVINRGATWETPAWRGGPSLPFAVHPTVHASSGGLVMAGNGVLTDVVTSSDLGVPLWETRGFFYEGGERVTVVGGGDGEYVAAGPDHLMFRFGLDEPIVVVDAAARAIARDPHGVSMQRGRAFVVGAPVELAARTRSSAGLARSPIEACDVDGCELERIETARDQALDAVWSDGGGHAIAVGDGWIVQRTSCGALRCDVE